MTISVVYEPTEWIAEWFDTPWYFECLHPVVEEIGYTTFDGEVRTTKICADSQCNEDIE